MINVNEIDTIPISIDVSELISEWVIDIEEDSSVTEEQLSDTVRIPEHITRAMATISEIYVKKGYI
jgi:hypothetical protein